jgi:hypothetical protein
MSGHDRGLRQRRAEQRRVRQRRRRLAALVVVAALAGVVAALASGGGSRGRSRTSGTVGRQATGASVTARSGAGGAPSAAAAAAVTSTTPAPAKKGPRRRAAPSPGALPQTHAFPSASSHAFKSRMAALWAGVLAGSVKPAEAAFFPEQAYAQLKSIAGAESDWQNRLLRDYGLDIGAAHGLLGAGASRARLLAVRADSSYGHWVAPGVCDNSIGYYEMPGARVVYTVDGAVRSFGIASMISWRGEWYVVHMGAVLREGEGGVVDEPGSGAGTPAYSGTC